MTDDEAKVFLQETFSLQQFQLRLLTRLDHSRILVEDTTNRECEIWCADPYGTLLLDGIKYVFSHDLIEDVATAN
jgi:hypothetical protein